MARLLCVLLFIGVTAPSVFAQNDLLASMSLEQRVAQMFMATIHGSQLNEPGRDFLRQWQPGGVVLFANNAGTPDAVTRLTNSFQQTMIDAGAPPLFVSVDQEGGLVIRLRDGFTEFPAPVLITAAGNDMARRMGAAVAEELSGVGINMLLAPVADLETNRENPIIFRRSFGNDPMVAGRAVASYVQGVQSLNVLATAKHFPGHGETREDSHGVLPRLDLTRERLASVELEPFRAAISANVAAVMVAHIWYPALDPDEQLPASLSRNVITGLLRDELHFNGLIVTDAMDMNAVDLEFNYADAAVMAVNAGADVLALGPGYGLDLAGKTIQYVVDNVRSGVIPEERINDAVRRILATKARFGVMHWQPLDPMTAADRVNAPAHEALIEELFRAGTTVAYDRNDLLPLTPDRNIAIVFLATRYQIQNECKAYNPNIRWVGVSDNPSQEEIGWAREAANWSDVTVVFTQEAIYNKEQQALVNALPAEKTVAVAIFSPYDWTTYPNVAAFVATYSPLRPAVPAACAVLFGAIPASGQLAVTLSPELPAGSHSQ